MKINFPDLPRYVGTTAGGRITTPGIYLFNSTSAQTWIVVQGTSITPRRNGASFWYIKNRGTAILTLTPQAGTFFDGASVASVTVAPGEGMMIFWDGSFLTCMRTGGVLLADSSGTPGAQTASTRAGRCSIAAAGTSVVVTNALCTAASVVMAQVATNDATAVIKNVVPAAGSFTITLNAAATATTNINWHIVV